MKMLFIQKKKTVLNLLTKLNRNDSRYIVTLRFHIKCSSYKGHWVMDLTQILPMKTVKTRKRDTTSEYFSNMGMKVHSEIQRINFY